MSTSQSIYSGENGIYPDRTIDEQAGILAKFVPTGKHLRAKFIESKNIYKTLRAFSHLHDRLEKKINDFANGRILTDSTLLLEYFERLAGIPDTCYPNKGTKEFRQKYAVAKLSADGVSLASELEWICSILGFSVNIIPGHYFWQNTTDFRVTFATEKESRFTVVFEVDYQQSVALTNVFPYILPIIFGDDIEGTMQCFITTLLDSNVNGKWIAKRPISRIIKDKLGVVNVLKDELGSATIIKNKMC